jgi:starvation-inducible DNA-binding protein
MGSSNLLPLRGDLGGVSIAMAVDVAETTQIEQPPRGREEIHVQLFRLPDAHQIIIRRTRKLVRPASELGDDGINDLLVSEVLRTNEASSVVPERAFG